MEFALCLPVLLLVVTGILSFGMTIHNYLELTDAVSVSARLLSVKRLDTTDPCNDAFVALQKAAPSLVKQGSFTLTTTMYRPLLAGGGGGTVLNTYAGTSCPSSSNTTGAAGNLVQYGSVQLRATYPCSLGVFGHVWQSCTLTSRATEMVQ